MSKPDSEHLPPDAWRGWAVATIATWNFVPEALVCLESFLAQHPGAEAHLILVERQGAVTALEQGGVQASFAESLGVPRLEDLAFKYSPLELSTALKPFVLDRLLDRPGVRAAVYLDADVLVLAPFDEARRQLETHDALFTPHLLEPMPRDGLRPTEIDFLRCGSCNGGFIAARQGETSRRFLGWWKEQLEEHCFVDLEPGVFLDQKWLDLALVLFRGVAALRHPGYNVAYWNLQERGAIRGGDGGWHAGEAPLVFFHFSGLDRENPDAVSRHQNRFRLETLGPDARRLFGEYLERLRQAGAAAGGIAQQPYSFGAFSNGVRVAGVMRRLYRGLGETRFEFGNPFDAEGPQSFFSWMLTPSGRSEGPLPPLVRFAFQTRHDVWRVYPDPEVRDRLGFLRWMAENGTFELGLDETCLAPIRLLIRQEEERVWALAEELRRQEEEREKALAAERMRLEEEQRAAIEALEARFSGVPEAVWKKLVAKAIGFEKYARLRKAFWISRGILRERKPLAPRS